MNFKTHQKIILENVETALSKSKVDLVSDFRTILPKAASLYKTDEFSFWIEELEKHPVSEIPMTVYGVKNAVNYLNTKEPMDRNSAVGTIAHICETLFTYQNENDLCALQSEFHYYYLVDTNTVFKISEMGFIEPDTIDLKGNKYRIALRSELKVLSQSLT